MLFPATQAHCSDFDGPWKAAAAAVFVDGGYDQQRTRSPPAITIATGFAATASHECANTGPSLTTVTDLHVTQSCSDFELHCLQCQATLPSAL